LYKEGTSCELKKIGFALKNQTLLIKQAQGHYAGKGKGKGRTISGQALTAPGL